MKFEEFYNKNYKKFMIIPLLILLSSLLIIGLNYQKYGSFFQRDVSLQGGSAISIINIQNIDRQVLEDYLRKEVNQDIFVRSGIDALTKAQRFEIEAGENVDENIVLEKIKAKGIELTKDNYSIKKTSAILGESTYKEIFMSMLIAFVFMAIVVFITYKSFIPSIAVVSCAFIDIIGTIAVVDLIGMKLSLGSMASILLLIGYSVDTDILMNTKVLKRKGEGTVNQKLLSSFKTGIFMTITSIIAVLIGYIFTNIEIFKQIFLIMIIGLTLDIFITYLQNASLLKWYAEKKHIE